MKRSFFPVIFFVSSFLFLVSFTGNDSNTPEGGGDSIRYARERHFANVRQLTFGGDNAEAYWSADGKMVELSIKTTKPGGCSATRFFTHRLMPT